MRAALGGPRVLLRRLREVMAEPVSAQERLDKIVVLIAANMVAEVCSVYVLRVDTTLELYATEGLNREAVHQTVLRSDEGLVGLVASEANAINLSDAQAHPAFSYRPETGEEIYHSFLGVPILRAGNTLGVLVVQNRAQRTYSEDEEEALQTTAMVLAETIASGELSALAKPGLEPAAHRPLQIAGSSISDGIGLGHAVMHEPRVVVTRMIADDPQKELQRLDQALNTLRADLDRLLERRDVADAGEHREVLEAYVMFAHDRGWMHKMHEAVTTGLTAEAAVERVQSDNRARMMRQTDPYLRERLHDLDDLASRLMRQLVGRGRALDGTGGDARLRPQEDARAGARGRRADLARLDRGARARHLGGRADRQCHRHHRFGRCHHRRWLDGARSRASDSRRREGLCGTRAIACKPPGAIRGAARQALPHQGRREDLAAAQCRPAGRSAAHRRNRRRRHRAVPHRIAVHGGAVAAAHRRTDFALSSGARRGRDATRDLPHARYRRRQGAALHALRRGGKSGARLSGDPPRARPAGPPAQPDPRHARCRGRARIAHHVPDGDDGRRVRPRQGSGRARAHAPAQARAYAARTRACRRDGRG